MTNPNNAVGTNGAYGGRTSVNALNDNLALYTSAGVLSGWEISASSGLTVTVGGSGTTRDVAVAQDNAGNKTTINNISESPISVTMPAAPAVNSRVDAVVAYVDNPPQGSSAATDNPAACGLIVVSGTATVNPSVPSDATIRSAITADGASGSVAYYAVLGTITIPSGTTDIDASMIKAGSKPSSVMLDMFYPVGTYYETSDSAFNPNTAWGGTWSEDTAGKVLVAKDGGTFATVGETGGAETSNHHHWQSGGSDSEYMYDLTSSGVTAEGLETRVRGNVNKLTSDQLSASTGAMRQSSTYDAAASTLQPYIVIKRWHRTA